MADLDKKQPDVTLDVGEHKPGGIIDQTRNLKVKEYTLKEVILQEKFKAMYPKHSQPFTKTTGRHNDFRSISERRKLDGTEKMPGPARYRPKKPGKLSKRCWRDYSKDTGRKSKK